MKNNSLLSKAECDALRGIAILGIMLHNYCHWLWFAIRENEYKFYMSRSQQLADYFAAGTDEMLPVQLLSYFGHYGVPIFLFLSGYGLTLKYERKSVTSSHSVWQFSRFHYLKLLRMMVPGFAAFIVVDYLTRGPRGYAAENVLALFGMVANLLPEPNEAIWPGPYWFFGLMMQLYVVYRLLLFRRHWGFTVGLVVLCWLAQLACGPESPELNWLRYNFIGGILPFGTGLLAARYLRPEHVEVSQFHWSLRLFLLSVAIIAGCFSFHSWLWVPFAICAAAVCLIKTLPSRATSLFGWFGTISAAMFVIHPVFRKIFIPISRHGEVYDGLLLYFIATLAFSWLTKQVMDKIAQPRMNNNAENKN